MGVNIDSLPNEILEHLLSFLDGVSLVKVSRVSSRWRGVTQNIIGNPEFWRQRCELDIPTIIKEELLTDKFTDEEVSNVDWKLVYATWYRCRFLGRWTNLSEDLKGANELSNSLGRISHIQFYNDFLFTSHGNANCGLVKQWDTISGEMQSTIARHPPPQRELHLHVLVPLRFRFQRQRSRAPEVLVVSASDAVRVNLVCPETKDVREVFRHSYSSTPTVATSSWSSSLFAAVAEDGNGAIYRFKFERSNEIEASVISTFLCPYRIVESISLWKEFLVTGSGDGTVLVWRLVSQENDNDQDEQQPPQQRPEQPPQQRPEQPPQLPPQQQRLRQRRELNDNVDAKELLLLQTYQTKSYITQVFIRGEFLTFINEAGILTTLESLMETSKPRKRNLFAEIQARPSAIALFASLLAVGDEAGKVTVFDLSSSSSIFSSSLSSSSLSSSSFPSSSSSSRRPPFVFRASSCERISEIVLCDDGQGPTMIILSGKTNVQTVRFFHPSI